MSVRGSLSPEESIEDSSHNGGGKSWLGDGCSNPAGYAAGVATHPDDCKGEVPRSTVVWAWFFLLD